MGNEFKNIFDAILENSDKEDLELANTIFPNGFNYKSISDLEYRIKYPVNSLLKGILIQKFGKINLESEFLIKNSDFVENAYQFWIEKIEGSACSYDKSGYIINSIIRYYTENKEIKHDYSDEKEYWLPKKIFTTHDEIIDYFYSLISLFHGNYEKYLILIQTFINKIY